MGGGCGMGGVCDHNYQVLKLIHVYIKEKLVKKHIMGPLRWEEYWPI